MDKEAFVEALAKEGFSEQLTVKREPDGGMDMHTHPFEAKALILDGEISIVCDGTERVFGPGSVRYLVGRRQA